MSASRRIDGWRVDDLVIQALMRGPLLLRELIAECGVGRGRVEVAVRRLVRNHEVTYDVVRAAGRNVQFLYRLEAPGAIRDEREPFARVMGGRDARTAANRLLAVLPPGRSRMLVMDDDGRLYAVSPSGRRAAAVLERHRDWVIGTYAAGCDVNRVALDIRAQACAMSRAAA